MSNKHMNKRRWKSRQELKSDLVTFTHRYHNHRLIAFDSIGILLGIVACFAFVIPIKLLGCYGWIVALCLFIVMYFTLPKFEGRLARWAGLEHGEE